MNMAYDEIFRNSIMAHLKSVENIDENNLDFKKRSS